MVDMTEQERYELEIKEQQEYLEKWFANKKLKQNRRKEKFKKLRLFLKGEI